MNKEEIFQLWKKVLKGDRDSKNKFVNLYLEKYPHNKFLTENLSENNLHVMYLHLYK
jgi:hypothetical protein